MNELNHELQINCTLYLNFIPYAFSRQYTKNGCLQRLFCLLVGISLFYLSSAQSPLWLHPATGLANQSLAGLTFDQNDHLLLCGHFQENLDYQNNALTSDGSTDLFLIKTDADGQFQWIKSGHSTGANRSIAVHTDADDNVYWAGEYWLDCDFGSEILSAEKSSKSIFVFKYDADGNPIWSRAIHATQNKTLAGMTTDETGHVYLTGNFSDSLFVENIVLTATADKDFFLVKLNADGQLLWAKQAGVSGEPEPNNIVFKNGKIGITGSMYNTQIIFGTDTLQNNTNDTDGFLAVYNEHGNVEWARKIGGVNEQFANDAVMDEAGNIYVAGSFFGVIRLSDDLEIMSQNLNENLLLIQYDETGEPQWARSIGSLDVELAEKITYHNQRLLLTGFFKSEFDLDGFTLTATSDNFNSFVLSFDTSGVAQNAATINGTASVLANEIALQNNGQLLLGGAWNDDLFFGNDTYTATSAFDIFIAKFDWLTTSTTDVLSKEVNVFPNPVERMLSIDAEQFLQSMIYDVNGRLVHEGAEKTIDVSNYPIGVYFLKMETTNGKTFVKKIIKK